MTNGAFYDNEHTKMRTKIVDSVFSDLFRYSNKVWNAGNYQEYHTFCPTDLKKAAHIDGNLRVCCHVIDSFRFNGPLRQYFTLYRAVSQRGRKKRKKMSKQHPTAPTASAVRLSKFTQHFRTTRPHPPCQ